MSTLYERVATRRGGKAALAAARLRREVLIALHEAFHASGLGTQSELARRLGVRRSAVNQVFRGDGNLRVNTVAEYLHVLGFELDVRLVPAGEPRRAELDERPTRAAFALWIVPPTTAYSDPHHAPEWPWIAKIPTNARVLPGVPEAIEMTSGRMYSQAASLDFGPPTYWVFLAAPSHGYAQRAPAKSMPESTSGQIAIESAGNINAA